MSVFKLETDWDSDGYSPWDALWSQDDEFDEIFGGEKPLVDGWKSPKIHLERRQQRPDIFICQLQFAVTERVRDLLLPLVKNRVEFLPIRSGAQLLFIMHPLIHIDLDDHARVSRCDIGGNITAIRRYSFAASQLKGVHVFQVRNPVGSRAREGGYAVSGFLVSDDFKRLIEQSRINGVAFKRVFGK